MLYCITKINCSQTGEYPNSKHRGNTILSRACKFDLVAPCIKEVEEIFAPFI